MTINDGCNFSYAGESSEEHGVVIGSFDSSSTSSNDEEYELISSTTPYIDKWHFHGLQKKAPLQFPLTIFQPNGDFIDSEKERELKKWLVKRDGYHWLQIEQDDISDIYYHCMWLNPRKENVGKYSGGMSFDIINSSPWAWTGLKTDTFTSNGSLTFRYNVSMDFDDYELFPVVTITSLANQTIKIKNNTTGVEVIINNCSNGEIITLDGAGSKIKTSLTNRILISDWNKKFASLIDGTNNIGLTGNFSMKLSYRLPIRVGG